jgi:alkylation response protein AidB-like acyl-CoA dehydrogenase
MTTTERTDWTAVAEKLGSIFAERASRHDADDSFVSENYADLRASRVFAAGVPAELGGGDAGIRELANFLRVLGRHCSSTALALSMHTHQVAMPAWRWRNEQAPVEGLLKRVAAEQIVLISSGGSDWLPSSGTAEKDGDGFRITARKAFASGVPAGTLLMTSAVYADPTEGPTVLHFPLPLQAEGVKIVETWRTLGMRATGSHDVAVEGARIPESAVGARRPVGKWHPLFHLVAMIALPIVYSVYVGIAEAARDIAVRQVARKKNDPDTQCLVGEIENQLRTAQIALESVLDIASRAKPGPETTNEVMIRRTIIGQACVRTVDKAMEAVGGAAFYRNLGLERLFRDVQGARFHPLPEKAQTRLAGRIALGVDIDD